MLTRNRRLWLPWSLRCAQYQTYQPTEILVIADGEDVSDLIPPGVRYLHLAGKPTVGRKRNVGCEAATGEVIAHFDDDDFSHPDRLEGQIERLTTSGAALTGFHTMRFTDGARWWQYKGATRYALGTSLVYWRSFWQRHRFPELQVGEDNQFVGSAHGSIVSVDAGEMQWATIHPSNTSPRNLNGKQWEEL
jgi:glycosyltransferase involved in cell wall biosynthesis